MLEMGSWFLVLLGGVGVANGMLGPDNKYRVLDSPDPMRGGPHSAILRLSALSTLSKFPLLPENISRFSAPIAYAKGDEHFFLYPRQLWNKRDVVDGQLEGKDPQKEEKLQEVEDSILKKVAMFPLAGMINSAIKSGSWKQRFTPEVFKHTKRHEAVASRVLRKSNEIAADLHNISVETGLQTNRLLKLLGADCTTPPTSQAPTSFLNELTWEEGARLSLEQVKCGIESFFDPQHTAISDQAAANLLERAKTGTPFWKAVDAKIGSDRQFFMEFEEDDKWVVVPPNSIRQLGKKFFRNIKRTLTGAPEVTMDFEKMFSEALDSKKRQQ